MGLHPAVPRGSDLCLIMKERVPNVAFHDRLALEACAREGGSGYAANVADHAGGFHNLARPPAGSVPIAMEALVEVSFFVPTYYPDHVS